MTWKFADNPIVLVAAACLVVAAYMLLVYFPLARHIAKVQDNVKLQEAVVAQQPVIQAEQQLQQKELAELKAVIATWPEQRQANLFLSRLMGEISTNANLAGVSGLRLEPGEFERLNSMQRIPIKLGCRGSFSNIHNLLCRVEGMPQELWIQRVTLAPGVERQLECDIEFEAFVASPVVSN